MSDKHLKKLGKAVVAVQVSDTPRKRAFARRRFFAAVKSLKGWVDRAYPVLSDPKERPTYEDWVRAKAKKVSYNSFQYVVVKPGAGQFDVEKAQDFVDFYADLVDYPKTRVVQDLEESGREGRLLGEIGQKIRLQYRLSDSHKWRVLLHEVAHMKGGHGHGRKFTQELCEVWLWFRTWKRSKGLPAAAQKAEEGDGHGKGA